MYQHVLLPTDGSPISERAVSECVRFAKSVGARVTALHVTPPFNPVVMNPGAIASRAAEHEARSKAAAKQALDFAATAAAAAGVPCAVVHRESETPWDEIVATAERLQCDLIVMGSHGRRGLSAALIGSATQNVIAHAQVPVLVVH